MAETLYQHTDKDGDVLKILSGGEGGDPMVGVKESGEGTFYACVTEEQAVPFALAVLKATGHKAGIGHPESLAVQNLEHAIREREQIEDEQLNIEATALMLAYHYPTKYKWDQLSAGEQKSWREAALRARKIHESRD